jgi:alpha-N-arabinofuranosidase
MLLETRVENETSYIQNGESLPQVNISASRDEAGNVHCSLCNLDPNAVANVEIMLAGMEAVEQVSGQILTAKDMNMHNTFSQPENLKPTALDTFSLNGQNVTVQLAPMSVTVLKFVGKGHNNWG